jgi:hypothetical protein
MPVLGGMRDSDGCGVRRGGMGDLIPRQDEVGIDLAGDGKQRHNEDDDHGSHGLVDGARLRLNRFVNWGQIRQTSRRKTEWLTATCARVAAKHQPAANVLRSTKFF